MRKEYRYKIYNVAGTYLTTWEDVVSAPRFISVINSSLGSMDIDLGRKFDAFGESVDVALNNTVKIYVIDQDAPNGTLIYQGYISAYKPSMDENGEMVTITLMPNITLLEQDILVDGAKTTVTYSSVDPITIAKDIIDTFNNKITYTTPSMTMSGEVVSYTYNTATYLQALETVLKLCPYGYYFYIDKDNVLNFHKKVDTDPADHNLFIGKHLVEIKPMKRMENVKNIVLFVGDGIYKKYTRAGSAALYGNRVYVYQDNRVSLTATADILASNYLDSNENIEIRTKIRVIDNNYNDNTGYDIESFKLGDYVKIKNFGIYYPPTLYDVAIFDIDYWDSSIGGTQNLPMQIISIDYTPDYVDIELSSRPIPINRRVEDIYRNLVNYINTSNSITPTV